VGAELRHTSVMFSETWPSVSRMVGRLRAVRVAQPVRRDRATVGKANGGTSIMRDALLPAGERALWC
jgi:hypothetical protein